MKAGGKNSGVKDRGGVTEKVQGVDEGKSLFLQVAAASGRGRCEARVEAWNASCLLRSEFSGGTLFHWQCAGARKRGWRLAAARFNHCTHFIEGGK